MHSFFARARFDRCSGSGGHGGGAPTAATGGTEGAAGRPDVINAVPTPVVVIGVPGYRVVDANPAFGAIEPWLAGQDGCLFAMSTGGPFADACRQLVEHAAVNGQAAGCDELADGGGRYWAVRVAPVADTGAGPRSVLLTGWDVTPAVEARGAAEALARAAEDARSGIDHLMRDVNHRVKNSLQLVSSILTLQALTARDAESRHQFQESCGRIGTIAQVHQRLHARGRYDVLAFGQYLRDVGDEITHGMLRSTLGRAVVVHAEDADLSTDSAIPLALIVNELITNALRHAYTDGRPGEVEVRFARLAADGRWRLSVSDRGSGLPPGFDPARVDTLGIKVVRALAAQLRAVLTAEANDPGAVFAIEFAA